MVYFFWVLPYWEEGGAEPAPERGSVTQAKHRAGSTPLSAQYGRTAKKYTMGSPIYHVIGRRHTQASIPVTIPRCKAREYTF